MVARGAVPEMQRGLFEDQQGSVPAFVDPLLKYAGSKRWLVKLITIRLHAHLAATDSAFNETFFGSGALGLSLGWPRSIYADTNPDLVNLYTSVRDSHASVCAELDKIRNVSGETAYYEIRKSVWPENRGTLTSAAWAARTLWLNKNCFNGLHRYHQKNGHFNVPWGKRENVALPSQIHLERVSKLLASTEIHHSDFAHVLDAVVKKYPAGKVVHYFDPPYGAKLKNTSTRGAVDRPEAESEKPRRSKGKKADVFTGYTDKFTWKDQVRLGEWACFLQQRGDVVIASNSWADEILDLYRPGFAFFQLGVRHSVGATGSRRGRRAEMLAISEAHAGVLDSIPAKIVRRK